MNVALSPDFTARSVVTEDAEAISDIMVASDVAIIGHSDFEPDALFEDWRRPGFDLAKDARLVTTQAGLVVGYECILSATDNGRIRADGYVHPEYTGRGIGTYLLGWAETRARERIPELPASVQIVLEAGTYQNDGDASKLFVAEGFSSIRHFWRMEIAMQAPPLDPQWPEGIKLQIFTQGQDEYATWECVQEAFKDHWGHAPSPLGDWLGRMIPQEDFDPTLWFLAMDGDQIAGAALCNVRSDGGWVRTLGVRRPYRRRGLGIALLYQAFGEFFRRRTYTVALGVDAQSLTGATRLYERAGMEIAIRFDVFGKELRPGEPM